MNRMTRRQLLRGGSCALAYAGLGSILPQLGLIRPALAGSLPTGYKALVCVYLAGGNDSWNLLMPGDASRHDAYLAARNGLFNASSGDGLGIPRPDGNGFVAGQTLPPALAINNGDYGINPFAPELATLYGEGRLAFLANIGPLIEPVTRASFDQRRVPGQLFSHNDQTALWQLGSADNAFAQFGFGGRIAGQVAKLPADTLGLPPVISLAGQSRFLVGTASDGGPLTPFALSTSATAPASTLSNYASSGGPASHYQPARRAALQELLAVAQPHLLAAEYRTTLSRAIDLAENVINPAIAAIPSDDPVNGGGSSGFDWPSNNSLADQLQQVARMIRISRSSGSQVSTIDANRQVYFVNLGGFDTHAGQIASATAVSGHHGLLQTLSQAVLAFQRAMTAIGAEDEVTLFSMSEFARTLNSNGDGTDHAWGGVQLVCGGAVNGGQIIGRFPSMQLDNQIGAANSLSPELGESFSRGQLIPTLAVDQLGATLAQWMGVAETELPTLFPNLDNFASGPFANSGASAPFAYFSRTLPGLLSGV